MMRLLALLLTAALAGCASPHLTMQRQAFRVYVYEDRDMTYPQLGRASFYTDMDTCIIALRRYPECLLHEIRHCIEGPWHGDKRNNEDC